MLNKLFPVVLSLLVVACEGERSTFKPPAPEAPPPVSETPSPIPEEPLPAPDAPPEDIQSMLAGEWELVQFGESSDLLEPVMPGTSYTFTLDFADGSVFGNGACEQRWEGTFIADSGFLQLNKDRDSSQGCFYSEAYAAVMLVQQKFFDIAFHGASYRKEGDSLVLENDMGVLVFRPSPIDLEYCFAPDPISSHRAPSDRLHIEFEPDVDPEPLLAAWEMRYLDFDVLEDLEADGTISVYASDRTISILQCDETVERLWMEVPDVPLSNVEIELGSGPWKLVQYGPSREELQPVDAEARHHFELDFDKGIAYGWNGCNGFSGGGFSADDGVIRLRTGWQTLVYCEYSEEYEE